VELGGWVAVARRMLDADAAEPTGEEREVLEILERDRLVLLVMFLVALPAGLLLAGERSLPNGWQVASVWVACCFAVYAAILQRHSMFTPCPRCGEPGKSAWWLFVFTQSCFECGLTLQGGHSVADGDRRQGK
jgi:hypothetical protein